MFDAKRVTDGRRVIARCFQKEERGGGGGWGRWGDETVSALNCTSLDIEF